MTESLCHHRRDEIRDRFQRLYPLGKSKVSMAMCLSTSVISSPLRFRYGCDLVVISLLFNVSFCHLAMTTTSVRIRSHGLLWTHGVVSGIHLLPEDFFKGQGKVKLGKDPDRQQERRRKTKIDSFTPMAMQQTGETVEMICSPSPSRGKVKRKKIHTCWERFKGSIKQTQLFNCLPDGRLVYFTYP